MVDWVGDLGIDPEAVNRQKEFGVLPALSLPDPEDAPVRVTCVSEPRKVENEKMMGGFAYFVDVMHDGVKKQMNFGKTLAQGFLVAGIEELSGETVDIIANELKDYETKDGVKVKVGKTYSVQKAQAGGEAPL